MNLNYNDVTTIKVQVDSSTVELEALVVLEPLCREIYANFGVELISTASILVDDQVLENRFVIQWTPIMFDATQEIVEILEQLNSIRILTVEIDNKVYTRCLQ